MRIKKGIYSLLFLFLVISLTGLHIGAIDSKTSSTDYKAQKFDNIKREAIKKGFVRIIAKIDVPNIEELTAESTGFFSGNKDVSYVQAAYNADIALDDAISISRNNILHKLNGNMFRINRIYSTLPYIALSVTVETLDKLRGISQVLQIVEDRAIPLPTEPLAQSEENGISSPMLYRTVEIVGAKRAWGVGYTGEGWYVAILDSGILNTHEMFQGKSIIEQCFASGAELGSSYSGDCPNGLNEMSGPGSAAHLMEKGRDYHGSHVSGIAAGNNHDTRFGVAKDAGIIAIQAFSYFPEEGDIMSWDSDQLKGLEYIYELRNVYNIASVNMSLGSVELFDNYCDFDTLSPVIRNLRAVGIATVIASGNDGSCGSINYPACINGAIAVSGTDKQDFEYYWGNWNDKMVELLAPGDSVSSATTNSDRDYGSASGTSMAAPHVAGAFAIMKQFDPNMTVGQIVEHLQSSGKTITSSKCDNAIPKSRINVGEAIEKFFLIAPPLNLSVKQVSNKSLLQTEYINELTWESNSLNLDNNITSYRIYVFQGDKLLLIGSVDGSTYIYLHRNVIQSSEITYAISALDAGGQESPLIFYTL